jgi:hypothetical protein
MGGCAVRSWVIWRCGEDDREALLRMLSVGFSVSSSRCPPLTRFGWHNGLIAFEAGRFGGAMWA